jgi:hypothetical protein
MCEQTDAAAYAGGMVEEKGVGGGLSDMTLMEERMQLRGSGNDKRFSSPRCAPQGRFLTTGTGLSASEVIHDVVDNCVDKSLAFPRSLSTRACKRRAKRAKISPFVRKTFENQAIAYFVSVRGLPSQMRLRDSPTVAGMWTTLPIFFLSLLTFL